MFSDIFSRGKFDYTEFINRKKDPSLRAPSRVRALYGAENVLFTKNNAGAELINSAVYHPEEYSQPEKKYLFLCEDYESAKGNNPTTEITGNIIFAFCKKPVGELTGFEGIVDLNGTLEEGVLRKSGNAEIQYRKGNIDPKTGQLFCPVPVGYVVKEDMSWYSQRTLAGQPSCQAEWVVDRMEVKETYYILDFILYLLSAERVEPKRFGENSAQRVFKINTNYGKELLKESPSVPWFAP